MKNNLTTQDTPIAAKPESGQIVPEYSLPDYLLVTTVLTEDYPVPATDTSKMQEDGQGWNIPIRRGEGQQPFGLVCWVWYSLLGNIHFSEELFLLR